MSRRIGHAILALLGLLVLVYPVTLGASSEVTCRGRQMQPGDVCPKADGSEVQSYEDRAAAAQNARPVIMVVGALVAGFGGYLLLSDLRRGRARA